MSANIVLLWIAIIVLLILVAVLAWKLWQSQTSRTSDRQDGADVLPRRSNEQELPPHRSSVPPPASAGPSSFEQPHTAPRRGTPPAAGAGSDAQSTGAQRQTYPPPRPRSGTPPPAPAGDLPGTTPSRQASGQPRGRTTARPPASAGGSDSDGDTKDPEPASPRRSQTPAPFRPASATGQSPAAALARVSSWGYQLQNLDLKAAAASPFDLLVIDYSHDGSDEEALDREATERLKRGPGGQRRLVYAYISVGEAESYRYYWQSHWRKSPPEWLIGANPDWKENYFVRFWDPQWQRILLGSDDSYIARIAAAGFDGIYLDRCDVYEEIAERHKKAAAERKDIEGDMVEFVGKISSYVRSRHPGFGIIMQNAEALLAHDTVRDAIDAIAKEELLFGLDTAEKRNKADDVSESRQALDLLRTDGKSVLVVEYLDRQELRVEATGALRALGYVPYMSRKNRDLASLETAQPSPAIA